MKQRRFFQGVSAAATAMILLGPARAREPVGSIEDVRKLEQRIAAVADTAMKSTVALISESTGASGSGVVASADGLILTAAHVVEGVEEVQVVFPDGKQVKGKVLGANLSKDIGLVKIEEAGPWPFIERGESKPLKAGDWVIAMGHSTGFDPARTPPVRFGRVVSDGPGNFLTSDCTLIGGDSGGPLFDLDGKIVGINSSIGDSLKNNNHAGVDGFKDDWDRLIAGEVWGQLQMNPLRNPERPVMGIALGPAVRGGGVVVSAVTAHASKAGIRQGDVILTVDGSKVRDGANLQVLLAKKQAGDTVKVGGLRAETPFEVEVELKTTESTPVSEFPMIMKAGSVALLLQAALLTGVHAQGRADVPLMRPEEAQEVQRQTVEFFEAIRPASRGAMPSTVWVGSIPAGAKKPVVFGTVIGDGTKVLTKWSEIAMARGAIQIVGGDGTTAKATVLGVYQEEDLALLQLDGASFPAVAFTDREAPKLGRFLIATSPDDTPASVGVVAVEARSLREKDQAFLGVRLDPNHAGAGVGIIGVEDGSAAEEAGLKGGDVILSVGGRKVQNLIEVQTALARHGPGDRVAIRYLREGAEAEAGAVLKEKSGHFPQIPNGRLRQMERMGSELSLVRGGFPAVIQTDMQLDRDRCGGPVVDLDGKLVGIAIARADRTRSFVIPSKSIVDLLARNPVSPDAAQAAAEEPQEDPQQVGQPAPGPGQMPRAVPIEPGAGDRMRRNLEDMQRLLERMREEMEMIEE